VTSIDNGVMTEAEAVADEATAANVEPEVILPEPPNPAGHLQEALDYINRDIEAMYKRRDNIVWFQKNILPLLPAGVDVSSSSYDYYSRSYIEVVIAADPRRTWRQTALILFRTRKALGISKLTREVTIGWNNDIRNKYTGTIDKNPFPQSENIRVTISLGNQLPPTCKIEEVEELVPATEATVKMVRKVVCAD
jgi:hypothetical protein